MELSLGGKQAHQCSKRKAEQPHGLTTTALKNPNSDCFIINTSNWLLT